MSNFQRGQLCKVVPCQFSSIFLLSLENMFSEIFFPTWFWIREQLGLDLEGRSEANKFWKVIALIRGGFPDFFMSSHLAVTEV